MPLPVAVFVVKLALIALPEPEKSAVSVPAPPVNVSLPPPPSNVSLPPLPSKTFAPPSPVKVSPCAEPVTFSTLLIVSLPSPVALFVPKFAFTAEPDPEKSTVSVPPPPSMVSLPKPPAITLLLPSPVNISF